MPERKPAHLRKMIDWKSTASLAKTLEGLKINTICREARCPNIGECSSRKEASFLILGTLCTRQCKFCHVEKSLPLSPDPDEPSQVAEAVQKLGLAYVVITSPTRDDLPDGGASIFKQTVHEIHKSCPDTSVEILIPDFQENLDSLKTAAMSGAVVIGHNIETIPRLYEIRKGANYESSLRVLKKLKELNPGILTKTAILLGLGETASELKSVFKELADAGVDLLSLGQYLAPSKEHAPVVRYLEPEEYEELKKTALSLGIKAVESGPFVRSSYKASEMAAQVLSKES